MTTPLFNWRHSHTARVAAPCIHCTDPDAMPTYLRDDKGMPAHKVCAELAYAHAVAKTAASYRRKGLL